MKRITMIAVLLLMAYGLKAQEINNLSKIRLAVNGGYSYRMAKVGEGIPSFLHNYVQGLKSGYHIGFDGHYFFSTWGVGLSYSLFNASNSIANVQATDVNGNVKSGTMQDDITIQFVGPSAASRYISASHKHVFVSAFALGYLSYQDKLSFAGQSKITGSTLGGSLDVGYDYQIAKQFYVGAKIAFMGGVIKKIDYTVDGVTKSKELAKDEYENLGRLDVSLGLRLCL